MTAGILSKRYWSLWWLIAAASLFLRTGIPIFAIGNAAFDDALFIRQARYLGGGHWLGPFDNLTFLKGMFYPLFILISFILSIPLNVAEQAVYLASALLAARFALRVSNDRWLALSLFAVLAFNPVLFTWSLARVIREGLYLSLSFAAVVLLMEVVFPPAEPSRRRGLKYGVSLGLVFGAFWLTREEGVWLLPAMAVAALIALAGYFRLRWRPASSWLRPVGIPLGVACLTFALTIGSVAGLNDVKYGVFITNEFSWGPFLRAYGAVSRIGHDQ